MRLGSSQINNVKAHVTSYKLESLTCWSLIFISLALYLFTADQLWPKVLLLTSVVFFTAAVVRFELSHPFVWLGFPFLIYYISFPILYDHGLLVDVFHQFIGIDRSDMLKVLDVALVAYLGFIIGCGPKRESINPERIGRKLRDISGGAWLLWIIGVTFTILGLVLTFGSDAESKQELIASSGIGVSAFTGTAFLYPSSVALILYAKLKGERLPLLLIFCTLIFLILGFLVVGQRELVFRFLVMLAVAWHIFFRRITLKQIALMGIVAMALATFMQGYKLFLITNKQHPTIFVEGDLANVVLQSGESGAVIYYLLGSEFRTASENLAISIDAFPQQKEYLYGKSIFWDITRVLVPGFIVSRDVLLNTALWFNREFYPALFSSGAGPGFSLVAEGYINFGYIGAFLWLLLVGFCVRKLYHLASKNFFGLVFYIVFIPLMILSLRQDLAAPLSQGIKHIALPILFMMLAGSFLRSLSVGRITQPVGVRMRSVESRDD